MIMLGGNCFESVARRTPGFYISFDSTAAPDRSSRVECRRFSGAGRTTVMETSSGFTREFHERRCKSKRHGKRQPRVSDAIQGEVILPILECSGDLIGMLFCPS